MPFTPPAWIASVEDAPIRDDLTACLTEGQLTRDDLLGLLQSLKDVVDKAGTLNEAQYASLQTIAFNLHNGVQTEDYAASIFTQLVTGSPANATFTGGLLQAEPLGDLDVGSTARQLDRLIDKWFLGADRPDPRVEDAKRNDETPTYKAFDGPLFGASGGPTPDDIVQGGTGDCEFLSCLAEATVNHAAHVKTMIIANGDATYGVRFHLDGTPWWVTVDSALPVDSDGDFVFNGMGATAPIGLWASYCEKAFAQAASSGKIGHPAVNAYANITADSPADVFALITGDNSATTYDSAEAGWSRAQAAVIAAIRKGDNVTVESSADSQDAQGRTLFASDHAFAVVGYDDSTGKFRIRNPWGASDNVVAVFEATMDEIKAVGGDFVVSSSALAVVADAGKVSDA